MHRGMGIKETYAICMAVAGCVRAVSQLASLHNELAGELANVDVPLNWAGTMAQKLPLLPALQLDQIAELCVLAAELASTAERLHAESGVVQRMRRKLDAQKERDVSRETLPSGDALGTDDTGPDTDPMGAGRG